MAVGGKEVTAVKCTVYPEHKRSARGCREVRGGNRRFTYVIPQSGRSIRLWRSESSDPKHPSRARVINGKTYAFACADMVWAWDT